MFFAERRLERFELEDGISLWGATHQAPANTDNFLDGFQVEGNETHIALFHGAERSWFTAQGSGKEPHAPFDSDQIEQAGPHHGLVVAQH